MRNSCRILITGLIVCMGLIAALSPGSRAEEPKDPSLKNLDRGRYQIASGDQITAWILDTWTGDLWFVGPRTDQVKKFKNFVKEPEETKSAFSN